MDVNKTLCGAELTSGLKEAFFRVGEGLELPDFRVDCTDDGFILRFTMWWRSGATRLAMGIATPRVMRLKDALDEVERARRGLEGQPIGAL